MRYRMISWKKETFQLEDRFATNSFGKYYLQNPYYIYKVHDSIAKKEFNIIAVMSKEMSERIFRTEIIKNFINYSDYLFIPGDIQVDLKELLESLYDYDFDCFKVFPPSLKTYDLCLKYIKESRKNFSYVPLEFQDDNMLNYYVEELKGSIRYIELEKRSKELCLKALEINPRAIIYVPKKYITKEMWIDALDRDNKLIDKIPLEYLTVEKCIEIVLKDIYLMNLVPDEHFIQVYDSIFVKSKSFRAPYTFNETDLINNNYKYSEYGLRYEWFKVEKRLLNLKNMEKIDEGKIDEVLTGYEPVIEEQETSSIDIVAVANNLKTIKKQINIIDELEKQEQALLEQLESIRNKKREVIKIISLGFGGMSNE